MALPFDVDATWLNLASVELDAGEVRRADAAFLAGAGGVAYGGVARHSDTSLAVTVDGSDVVTVQPGSVVIPGNAVTGTGAYRSGIASAQTGNLTARNATNARIDLVVYRVLDTDVVSGHGAYTGRIEIIAGTPSATPAVPATPSMAVELARITVPASGGGAATVDSTHRTYTCAAGGELVVPTSARFPASAATGQRGRTLDTLSEWVYNGTAWTPAFQCVSGNVTLNASGDGEILFPVAFADQLLGYSIVDISDPGVIGAIIIKGRAIAPSLSDKTRVAFRVYDAAGTALASAIVTVQVTAWGR